MKTNDLPNHYFHTSIDEAAADPNYPIITTLQRKLIKKFHKQQGKLYKFLINKELKQKYNYPIEELFITNEQHKKFKDGIAELNLLRQDWRCLLTDLMEYH